MSVLDTTIEIAPSIPWGPAWLDRTLPSLYDGTLYTHQALNLCIIVSSIIGAYKTRSLQKQLKENDADRPRLSKQIEDRLTKMSRGHYFIAVIYLLCTFLISGIDAYITFVSLQTDVLDHSEIWTPAFVLELVSLTAGMLVLFSAVFILVPLAQACLAFWFLMRHLRKSGQNTLAGCFIQIRAISTALALFWTALSFLLQAWTSPIDAGIWRWILLQGIIGSAFTWLDASFTFNFRASKVKDLELAVATAGVRDVVAVFATTMVEVHAKGERQALLPKYQAAPQEPVFMDEKANA
nr:hypothetical protein CFP56_09977 [Quercus suber]